MEAWRHLLLEYYYIYTPRWRPNRQDKVTKWTEKSGYSIAEVITSKYIKQVKSTQTKF